MYSGPAIARGLENGRWAIHASKAGTNSGRNRRRWIAARSSSPASRASSQWLKYRRSSIRCWPACVDACTACMRAAAAFENCCDRSPDQPDAW